MHFPGLSCSGSGSWVLCKGTDSVGSTFLPFPGPSSSGNQMLGEHIVPGGLVILVTSPGQATWFPSCITRAPCQVYRVSPLGRWSQAATFLADVKHPGSQEDMVSNWEPAHSLVEDVSLWGWDCSLPSSSDYCIPASLPLAGGRALFAAGSLSCGICSILYSVSGPGCTLEPFTGKFFFFSLSLAIPQFGLLSHVSSLIVLRAFRPSPYPKDWWCSPCLPVQLLLTSGSSLAIVVRCVFFFLIFYFFLFFVFSHLCCPLRFQNSPQNCLWEGFLMFGNFSSFTTASLGQVSIPNSSVSLFVFYILSYFLLKRMACLSGCLVSSASIQK